MRSGPGLWGLATSERPPPAPVIQPASPLSLRAAALPSPSTCGHTGQLSVGEGTGAPCLPMWDRCLTCHPVAGGAGLGGHPGVRRLEGQRP